jgi:hypothetical protein
MSGEERAERIAEESAKMRTWLSTKGLIYKRPTGSPQYLVTKRMFGPQDQPFPENPSYRSEPVLSEALKERIWTEVREGQPIKAVSSKWGVDIRRVAAVVRLRELQETMVTEVSRPLQDVLTRCPLP